MNDYTPTTEEVRSGYAIAKEEHLGLSWEHGAQEFDRWLKQHEVEIAYEQRRKPTPIYTEKEN